MTTRMRRSWLKCFLCPSVIVLGVLSLFDGCSHAMNDSSESSAKEAASPSAASPISHAIVDATTLSGKVMFGYQGWFKAKNDHSSFNRWAHWSDGSIPGPGKDITVDMWPDTRELDPDETFATALHFPNGSVAPLYGSYCRKTVMRQVRWARDYWIDGFFVQRFIKKERKESEVKSIAEFTDRVLVSVREGAEAYGRVFAVMYDVSAAQPEDIDGIKTDWSRLVDQLQLTVSDRYLHHRGRPLVAIWGMGYKNRPGSPQQLSDLLNWFHSAAPEKYRATVFGGVPDGWRDQTGSAAKDPAWGQVIRKYDVISPWTPGRYLNEEGAKAWVKSHIEPDLADCRRNQIDYMPVVFPGFSHHNLQESKASRGVASVPGATLNQLPRDGGNFWWAQVYGDLSAGCNMLYGAMFDEVDEGTAMFKVAPNAELAPVEVPFVNLDADGSQVPSDWYLSLAREAGKIIRKEMTLTKNIPIKSPGSIPSTDRVNLVYQSVLDRNGNVEELRAGLAELSSSDANAFRHKLAASPEAEAQIKHVFKQVSGDVPPAEEIAEEVAKLSNGSSLLDLRDRLTAKAEAKAAAP